MEKSGSSAVERSAFLFFKGGSANAGIDRQPLQIGLRVKDILDFFPPETNRNKRGLL